MSGSNDEYKAASNLSVIITELMNEKQIFLIYINTNLQRTLRRYSARKVRTPRSYFRDFIIKNLQYSRGLPKTSLTSLNMRSDDGQLN